MTDRLNDLEKRVARLELKVDRPPVEDIRAWVTDYYDGRKQCAEACGVSLAYIDRLWHGNRPASDKIIRRMIEDGFYGLEMMG